MEINKNSEMVSYNWKWNVQRADGEKQKIFTSRSGIRLFI